MNLLGRQNRLSRLGSFSKGASKIWPSIPAFSPNNFLDHFSSLDTSKWGTILAGTGAVNVTDSYANLDAPINSAAALYYKTKIDKTKSQLWTICINNDGVAGAPNNCIFLVNKATAPVADSFANFNTNARIISNIKTDATTGIQFTYFDGTHTQFNWDASVPVWSSVLAFSKFADLDVRENDYYIIALEIDAINARFRLICYGKTYTGGYRYNQGYRMFALSDFVNFSSLEATTDLWLVIGNPYNSNGQAANFKVEWIRYSESVNNTYIEAWCDNSGTGSSAQRPRHYYSYDGLVYLPQDRTTFALALGPGTYDDLDISPVSVATDGTTDYMAYQGSGSITVSGINIASAAHTVPQNGAWTKSVNNPIIGLGAGETIIGFPFLFKDSAETDSNKRWKILFSVKLTADNKWRLHLATSPDPPTGNTWTRQGVILNVGVGGSQDELAARDGISTYVDNQWIVWYEGWDSSGNSRILVATGPNLTSLTKDGLPARIGFQAAGDTPLTANLTGRTVTVTSTTGFSVDGLVVLCQSNAGSTYSISRVRKIISSTQLELYTGLDGFTTTVPCRIAQIDSVHYCSPKNIIKVGNEWWYYITIWGTFLTYDGANYAAYRNQMNGLYKHSTDNPLNGTPVIDLLSFPITPVDFNTSADQTVENLSLMMVPFT